MSNTSWIHSLHLPQTLVWELSTSFATTRTTTLSTEDVIIDALDGKSTDSSCKSDTESDSFALSEELLSLDNIGGKINRLEISDDEITDIQQ